MSIAQVINDGNVKYKVSGKIDDVKLKYDRGKYIISPYSFDVTLNMY